MFVDSSALVAMIAGEVDGQTLARRLEEADFPLTSSVVVFETVLALARIRRAPVSEMLMVVLDYLERAGVETMPVTGDAHVVALGAHSLYGKGTGHPAQLNMGDCFSYALAKKAGVPLLYKGDDFAQTDLA
jgi:ribonuclease VapC